MFRGHCVIIRVFHCHLKVCYADEAQRVRRDVAEEGQKVVESLKGIFTEDTWNVSTVRRSLLELNPI